MKQSWSLQLNHRQPLHNLPEYLTMLQLQLLFLVIYALLLEHLLPWPSCTKGIALLWLLLLLLLPTSTSSIRAW